MLEFQNTTHFNNAIVLKLLFKITVNYVQRTLKLWYSVHSAIFNFAIICGVIINRFWNFSHHNSVISNDSEWKINNLHTRYKFHNGNLYRAKNNLQRILNLHDNLNKFVLAYTEWFYVNFKMADVWNWILERSVGRLKEDLSIDTTFEPP